MFEKKEHTHTHMSEIDIAEKGKFGLFFQLGLYGVK